MKRNPKTFFNATDAADFLGVSRQRFYVIKYKYQIKKHSNGYAKLDLIRVRKLLDKWKAAHGK